MASFIQPTHFISIAQAMDHLRHTFNTINQFRFHHTLATGGAGATLEVEEAAGDTIADIAKTEGHPVVISLGGALAANTVVTLTYVDNEGTEHVAATASGKFAAGTEFTVLDGAAVASVTDMYAPIACTASVADAALDITVYESGGAGKTYVTIAATATSALDAAMFGIGDVYGRSDTDDAAYDGYGLTLTYLTPWGEIKTATIDYTLNGAGGTDVEVRFADATTGIYVKDFYRRRSLVSSIAIQAGDVGQIGDDDTNPQYGAILAAAYSSLHSRYMVPVNRTAVLGRIIATYDDATPGTCTLTVTWTPKGETQAQVSAFSVPYGQVFDWDPACELEPLSEVTLQAADDAGAGGNLAVDLVILEAADPVRS
jgi:hypothetical protein